jgi:pilus assembly protein CpaF
MKGELLDVIYENDHLAELDPAERRLALRSLLAETIPEHELVEAVKEISDAVDGFGPLTELMEDERVSDVMVNGPHEVWIDVGDGPTRTDIRFSDETELRTVADRLLGRASARVNASHPIADGRLPDGSRINVVVPPVAGAHTCVSIRRFPALPLSLEDLVLAGTVSDTQRDLLTRAVTERKTIAISGGTGCGKTTLMNALLGLVPSSERVVTIEETPELRPACVHRVSLIAREPNSEGRGLVTQADLVRTALRMRPDRIVLGEVRGAEAIAALAAMSVGHEGSMVTLHARSIGTVIQRFVMLALQAKSGASEDSLRRQAIECFDLFVHVQRRGSTRRVVDILEKAQMP